MRGCRCFVALAIFSWLPLACGGSGTTPPPGPKGNIVLTDANNYTSVTSLDIPEVTTASGADLMVCWDGLMKDLLCHDIVGPDNGIDNVGFLQIKNFSHDQVKTKLAVGQLDPNLVNTYREFGTMGATSKCASLSQFKLGSTLMPATDYVAPAATQTITYMLLFTSGTTPGVGSKAMVFLNPSTTSTVMNVAAPDACSNNVLHFQATLGQPMAIPATDNTKWHIDWSKVTKDSFGNTVDFSTLKVDSVMVGYYQGMTAMDLQTGFKDIELTATKLYSANVAMGATDVDLVTAKDKDGGAAFPGFTMTDGVWALAVRCSKCQIPAPIVMTILQPQ